MQRFHSVILFSQAMLWSLEIKLGDYKFSKQLTQNSDIVVQEVSNFLCNRMFLKTCLVDNLNSLMVSTDQLTIYIIPLLRLW